MADDSKRPSLLVIRRKGKGGHDGHHGGAWKIAYADFVTAMMAFFLLMWLLGSTTKGEKAGIADYFNTPLSVALSGGTYSGGATSVLDGGGQDISRPQIGDVSHNDDTAARQRPKGSDTRPMGKDDTGQLRSLKKKIETLINQNINLRAFSDQIKLDITSEGLRIQIVDSQNRPMFSSGSATLAPYTHEILRQIGVALNDVDNRVSIAGHTDSHPYTGSQTHYSNWELSSERANAARRELIDGGMKTEKVIQVRGLADALPFSPDDPAAPMNRRISIVVLNRQTEAAFMRDRGRTDVNTIDQASAAIVSSGASASAAGARH